MAEQIETPPQLPKEEPESEVKPEEIALWKDTIQREARSLLGKYLPDALPQEPTEVMVDIQPFSIGKFRDRHYVAIANTTQEMERVEQVSKHIAKMETERKDDEEWLREYCEFLLHLGEKSNAGETLTEEDQLFIPKPKPQAPEPKPKDEEMNWVERLEKGQDFYSTHTWRDIHTLTHEMIHQRQAELNPEAFPPLSSPELDDIDPNSMDQEELRQLLIEAHKKQNRERKGNVDNIFYPVIEGMAVIGSYYAMAGLENDLRTSGNTKTADTVRQARREAIYQELEASRQARRGEEISPYDMYYVDGVNLMRKLYKKLGIKEAIKFTQSIDLAACRGIERGTPEFKKAMEDPATLPQLNSAAA